MTGTLAFCTTGDTRPVFDNRTDRALFRQGIHATRSNLYELFAFRHAAVVYSPNTIDAALQCLRLHRSGSVGKIYLVGHGNSGMYAFEVRPDPDGEVYVDSVNTQTLYGDGFLTGSHRAFVDEIVRIADRGHGMEVYFYCCRTAQGTLLNLIAQALHGIRHLVAGTRRDWGLSGVQTAPSGRHSVSYRHPGTLEVVLRGR